MRTISDFSIELTDEGEEGRHIEFVSASAGRLAGFPAWDHAERDLRHFGLEDIPIGSDDDPFIDADEGWRIEIAGDERFVTIREADDPKATTFPRQFRVPREDYLGAWVDVIQGYNPVVPLDEE